MIEVKLGNVKYDFSTLNNAGLADISDIKLCKMDENLGIHLGEVVSGSQENNMEVFCHMRTRSQRPNTSDWRMENLDIVICVTGQDMQLVKEVVLSDSNGNQKYQKFGPVVNSEEGIFVIYYVPPRYWKSIIKDGHLEYTCNHVPSHYTVAGSEDIYIHYKSAKENDVIHLKAKPSLETAEYLTMVQDLYEMHENLVVSNSSHTGLGGLRQRSLLANLEEKVKKTKNAWKKLENNMEHDLERAYVKMPIQRVKRMTNRTLMEYAATDREIVHAVTYVEDANIYENRMIKYYLQKLIKYIERKKRSVRSELENRLKKEQRALDMILDANSSVRTKLREIEELYNNLEEFADEHPMALTRPNINELLMMEDTFYMKQEEEIQPRGRYCKDFKVSLVKNETGDFYLLELERKIKDSRTSYNYKNYKTKFWLRDKKDISYIAKSLFSSLESKETINARGRGTKAENRVGRNTNTEIKYSVMPDFNPSNEESRYANYELQEADREYWIHLVSCAVYGILRERSDGNSVAQAAEAFKKKREIGRLEEELEKYDREKSSEDIRKLEQYQKQIKDILSSEELKNVPQTKERLKRTNIFAGNSKYATFYHLMKESDDVLMDNYYDYDSMPTLYVDKIEKLYEQWCLVKIISTLVEKYHFQFVDANSVYSQEESMSALKKYVAEILRTGDIKNSKFEFLFTWNPVQVQTGQECKLRVTLYYNRRFLANADSNVGSLVPDFCMKIQYVNSSNIPIERFFCFDAKYRTADIITGDGGQRRWFNDLVDVALGKYILGMERLILNYNTSQERSFHDEVLGGVSRVDGSFILHSNSRCEIEGCDAKGYYGAQVTDILQKARDEYYNSVQGLNDYWSWGNERRASGYRTYLLNNNRIGEILLLPGREEYFDTLFAMIMEHHFKLYTVMCWSCGALVKEENVTKNVNPEYEDKYSETIRCGECGTMWINNYCSYCTRRLGKHYIQYYKSKETNHWNLECPNCSSGWHIR